MADATALGTGVTFPAVRWADGSILGTIFSDPQPNEVPGISETSFDIGGFRRVKGLAMQGI